MEQPPGAFTVTSPSRCRVRRGPTHWPVMAWMRSRGA